MLRRIALAAALALTPIAAHAQFATIGPTPPVTDNGDRLATTAWVNNLIANGLTLASGKIWIGSAGNIATPQTPSGDCTPALTGVITCTQAAGNFQVIGNLTVGGSIIDGNGILATNIAAPATPAAGTTRIYVDSTTKTLSSKNDAGTVSNTVVASVAVANQFMTGISAAGVITRAQPAFSDLSGQGTCAQEPAMTGDVTSSAGSCALAIGANKVTRAMQAQGVARSVVGVTGNATANVADIQGTANQFLGVNSAGTALAFQTMSGDATLSGSAITVTGINGVNLNSAWSTWSPTVTCSTGTITTLGTVTARSKQVGKIVFFYIDIPITTNGTCAGFVQATLPAAAASTVNQSAVGRDNGATGKSLGARIVSGTSNLQFTFYDGTFPGSNGAALDASGFYETP